MIETPRSIDLFGVRKDGGAEEMVYLLALTSDSKVRMIYDVRTLHFMDYELSC